MLPAKWQEKHRILPPGGGARSGAWRNFCFQVEPLNAIADPECSSMTLMWASQVIGKTSVVEGVIGWIIDEAPCAIVAVFPTFANAVAWSKNRLGPMIERTRTLRDKVDTTMTKKGRTTGHGANTVVHKHFAGGWFLAGGSKSPTHLRAHTAKITIFEEVDGYPESSGEEGDVILLTEQRSATFPDSFSMKSGTPTLRGASRIEKEYELSDKRKWFVTCPGCKHEFVIMWSNIIWDKTRDEKGKTIEHHIETACLECPACKKTYNDRARMRMVEAGRWIATNPSVKGNWGWWANAFITLLKHKRGFKSWMHYWAARFLSAKKLGPVGMRTFQNLILAETYEVESEKPPEYEILYGRREFYPENQKGEIILPERCLFLVAGADVQQDRIEAEIIGVGLDEEIFGIQYKIFRGNTETPKIFNEFDQWIQRAWKHPSGHLLVPACACVDAANKPEQIYAYAHRCMPRKVFAIRGMRGYTPNWVSRSQGRNQRLFLLKIDTAKEALYSRLRLIDHGPGYQHFPANHGAGYDLVYFQQLTAEVMRRTFHEGRQIVYFDLAQSGGRNEALDARVYAMAAKEILNPDYEAIARNLAVAPLNDWRFPEKTLSPEEMAKIAAEAAAAVTPQPNVPVQPPPEPANVRPRFHQRVRGWSKAY